VRSSVPRGGRSWTLALVGGAGLAALALGVWLAATARDRGAARRMSPVEAPRLADTVGLDPRLREALDAAVERADRERSAASFGALGRLYNAHHYLEPARRCYEAAQRLDPADAEWPYHLGLLAVERGEVEAAIPLLRRVLELRPDYLPARARLGDLLLAENRLDEAQTAYTAAAGAAPDAPWGELGLGKVELRRGARERALEHLEHAHRLAPQHAETRYVLATVYRDLGRPGPATELLRGLEGGVRPERPPDPLLRRVLEQRCDLQAMITTANALLAEGRPAEAESMYREVLSYDPRHYDAHYDLGVLYGKSGRYQEARTALEAAVAARPESVDAHVTLGIAYSSLGELEAARREARRALELDPRHERAQRLLAGLSGSGNGRGI
jgi:tetratricopeptide (TPR) repeat protein